MRTASPDEVTPPILVAQIVITLDARGNIGLNGPLHDKILCLGMLELARKAVLDYQPAAINPLSLA